MIYGFVRIFFTLESFECDAKALLSSFNFFIRSIKADDNDLFEFGAFKVRVMDFDTNIEHTRLCCSLILR
jgi:hypothetical protein